MAQATVMERLHGRIVEHPFARAFTWMTRVLLFLAFAPSGIKKILNEPFTLLGPETSVGYFFDALHQTGWYYQMIGWAQILVGAMLLIPRTSALASLMYFPIILNIWAITVSMHFRGTWMITSMMLLANVYLLCWEYDRINGIWAAARGTKRL
jgi:uncharacterized membrane protein YphA (DoxX/SURF4 family)